MKLVLIFLSIVFCMKVSAQGTLQFNQVLTYSGMANCNGQTWSTPNLTVPANKVWKLNSVRVSNATGMRFVLNGIVLDKTDWNLSGSAIWFKASDVVSFGVGPTPSGSSSSCTQGIVVSIIEFNIIP